MTTPAPDPAPVLLVAPLSAAESVARADAAVSPVPSPRFLLAILASLNFVNILEFMMVMPLGPFFAKSLSIPSDQLGLLAAAYTLAAAISGIVSARFIDRFDRRTALLGAATGLAIATGAAVFASGLYTLLVARVLAGICGGPASALVMSIIGDAFPANRRGRATATVMASFTVASVLGIPLSLWLAANAGDWWLPTQLGLVGWRAPFALTAALGAGIVAMAWRALPPLRGHLEHAMTRDEKRTPLITLPQVRLGWGSVALAMMGTFAIVPFLAPYLVFNLHLPQDDLAGLYAWGGVAAFVGLIIFGQLTDRLGALPVLMFGAVLHVVTVVLFVLDPHPELPLAILFVLFMVGGTSRMIPLQAMTTRVVPPRERGRYMASQNAVQHLAISVAALVVTALISEAPDKSLVHFDRAGWIAIGSNLALVVMGTLLARWIWRSRREAAAQSLKTPATTATA
jgi:predicted MFS family arabinose efflux permease